jgi:PAS domain S-box-containing protein
VILAAVHSLIVVLDRHRRIEAVTASCEATFGRTSAQMRGSTFGELFKPVEDVDLSAEIGQLEAGTLTGKLEGYWLCADGRCRWIAWTTHPVRDAAGQLEQVVLAGTDLTERKQTDTLFRGMNAALERLAHERTAQLEAANRELEAFSYSVSHDLRAPLRSIDGFSQALMEDSADKLDAVALAHLTRVRKATQRMGELIDDLLALSRVTRVPMIREPVDLTALARAIAEGLTKEQPERKVGFVIAEGLTAQADSRLVKILLENLIGNAWKFTSKVPAATIELGATTREGGRFFFVRDDGAGFDMAYAKKLFGAFQRMHSASEFEGNGIGLATVQRVTARHGGKVAGEGEPGKGATFYFSL